MLLVICDHTFPLLSDIAKKNCLGNKMANYVTFVWEIIGVTLLPSLAKKKCQEEKEPLVMDAKLLIQSQLKL